MECIKRIEEIEAKKALARKTSGDGIDHMENSPHGTTRDAVAEQVGISSNTIAREKNFYIMLIM